MGWFNPDVSWAELERQMSGRTARDRTVHNPEADSAPGYSHKRPSYAPDSELAQRPSGDVVPYAELHCHSNFSFLDGVNDPEELIEEAVRLGLDAMAITDHDGFYAASRFAEAAAAAPLRGDEKGRPLYDLDELAERADGHWVILTGCRKGAVRSALDRSGPAAA